jgi:hypothetical protein
VRASQLLRPLLSETSSSRRFRPCVEELENRWLPAVLTVTSAADNALAPPPGSLRATLANASNGDTIVFAPSLANQAVILQGSAFPTLAVTKNVTISSGGVPGIDISGNFTATVFTVSSGVTATIDSLTISNGQSQPAGPNGQSLGGGILNNGSLTVSNCTLVNNQAAGGSTAGGGGIANLGTLAVVNCTLNRNKLGPSATSTSNIGAGIDSTGTLSVYSCTIFQNDAMTGSGGGLAVMGNSTVDNSIVANNPAASGPDVFGTLTFASNDLFTTNPSITSGRANLFYTMPMLDPNGLQYNGGPTPTIAELPNSPSIDAGNPAFVTNPPFQGKAFTDQRGPGFLRIINKTDIGAFEDQSFLHYVAYGSDPGESTSVAFVFAIDKNGGQVLGGFDPFQGIGFTGGLHVATGDINGDGIPDLIVGSGRGGVGVVLVYDGASVIANPSSPTLIRSFNPYGHAFIGGVFVATGHLDGGPGAEIITGTDGGGAPQVNIYSSAQIMADSFGSPATSFLAYPFGIGNFFTGGVRVAAADINGDGLDDLITTPGPGGLPEVNIYLGTASGGFVVGAGQFFPTPSLAFLALGPTLPTYTGGINVAAGNITSDGKADLFFGADTNSEEVAVFSGAQLFGGGPPNLAPLTAFFAFGPFAPYPGEPPVPPGEGGVQLALSLGTIRGPQPVPVLLTASTQIATESSDAALYDALAIFQHPGVPPTSFSDVFPFGTPGGSSC